MSVYDTMNELNRLKQSTFWASIFMGIGFGISMVIFMFFSNSVFSPALLLAFAILMILGIIGLANYTKSKKAFRSLYKNTFVATELNNYFSNVFYDWKGGFSQDAVRSFGISRLGNRFHSEDYLSGTYKDIRFEQADVKIQYHSSNGRNSTTVTYFEGRMFKFDFPKNAVVSVQLHSKNFGYMPKSPSGLNTKKINLESEAFNKKYKITSVNEHDAFYILTPALMQRIDAIYNRYKTIQMHFSRGQLYVGINDKSDAFDPPMNGKALSYPEEQARIRRDIQVIIDIIDTMTETAK